MFFSRSFYGSLDILQTGALIEFVDSGARFPGLFVSGTHSEKEKLTIFKPLFYRSFQ